MKLSILIKEKIMFSRIIYVSIIAFLSSLIFWLVAISIYFYTYLNRQELNGGEIFASQVLLIFSFFLSILIFDVSETVEERNYDDFIKSFNHSLQNELANELSKVQKDFKIDILSHKVFALKLCQSNYKKGELNEILINKTKSYYINFFRKKIAKQLKEEQQEFNLKSIQEIILKELKN
ncbi:hypothetical protein [Campylobacter coli]|uniref:hypothetical protein n=1 Tax=Campylobacter coli TaxID=195 RepID=UPI0011A2BEEA|nr:hypothetical protein [Campylobacter coli]